MTMPRQFEVRKVFGHWRIKVRALSGSGVMAVHWSDSFPMAMRYVQDWCTWWAAEIERAGVIK